MNRIRAALRALWNDPDGTLGFLEAITSSGVRLRRNGVLPGPVSLNSPEVVQRVLTWLHQAASGVPGYPSLDTMLDRIVAGYERSDEQDRSRLRAELVRHLESPGDALFTTVLRLAWRIPLPEARARLLGWLTTPAGPFSSAAAPRLDADGRPGPCAGSNGQNGAADIRDTRAQMVRALAALRDPTLAGVFRAIVHKYEVDAADDARVQELVRQAVIGLVLLDSAVLGELPVSLCNDLLLFDELAALPHPEIRRALKARIDRLSPSSRARIGGGLVHLRSLIGGFASRR